MSQQALFLTKEQEQDILKQSSMRLQRSRNPEQKSKAHSYWSVVLFKKDQPPKVHADFEHNVIPSVFIDQLHNMVFVDTTASKRGFGCIALTANTAQTLDAAITSLTGEITTNGLARVEAGTKTHTNGTNTTLIEHTFTLSGTQSDMTRSALFNVATAPVSGIIGPVAPFSNGATGQMISGETIKVSITATTS